MRRRRQGGWQIIWRYLLMPGAFLLGVLAHAEKPIYLIKGSIGTKDHFQFKPEHHLPTAGLVSDLPSESFSII
jgi:hypothetical protein